MNREKKPEIKAKLEFKDKIVNFLHFKEYIIAIPYNSNKISFYDINNSLKISFTMDFNQDKLYEQWKIFTTKNNELFLIGYFREYKDYLVLNENKNLGIYLLNIEKKTIEKKASFNYNHFVQDKKEDKLYIINNKSIIAYNFITNTSNIKDIEYSSNHRQKFILVDDYLLLFTLVEVARWIFGFSEVFMIDKHFENIIQKELDPFQLPLYDFGYFDNFKNSFQQITDNIFFINSDSYGDSTNIELLEIRLKGNENILNDIDYEKLENVFIERSINIKDGGISSLYSLDDEKFVINNNNNKFYVCDAKNLKKITKMELNLQLNNILEAKPRIKFIEFNDEKGNYWEFENKILLFKLKGPYYEFYYLSVKNELLYITNKRLKI